MKLKAVLRCFALLSAGSLALAVQAHPLTEGLRWPALAAEMYPGQRIVLDDRVKVIAPAAAEDAANVPVGVRIEGLAGVTEVHVLADYNPIVKAVEFFPLRAQPALTFRIKLQQTTPIRALARTQDGVWHMGGVIVDAAGGGCTAPSLGSGSNDWRASLNQVSARMFSSNTPRLRFQVQHPMDTGLAPGIPAFFLAKLDIVDSKGEALMRIHPFEPISENPVFSIDLPPGVPATALAIRGVDNQGNKLNARVGL